MAPSLTPPATSRNTGNIVALTLGGDVFWRDLTECSSWHLQQNAGAKQRERASSLYFLLCWRDNVTDFLFSLPEIVFQCIMVLAQTLFLFMNG